MDWISIDDISCYAYHGLLPEERELGQEFEVSLELGTDFKIIKEDRIEDAVDYRRAVEVVQDVLYGDPCRLLETLAEKIADRLLQLPGIEEVQVEVRKPNPPIPRLKSGVGVSISRSR